MLALLKKIELWWITEFEIPINPDMDGKEIDVDRIIPGPVLVLQMLCDVALGDEQTCQGYLNELRKVKDGLAAHKSNANSSG
jgi:hypothetical protein